MLAAASKETFAPAPTVATNQKPLLATTPTLATAQTSLLVTTATAATTTQTPQTPTDPPLATPQTPLLTALGLQQLPIIGPVLVTPIVAFLGGLPLIGDILHPIIGYPLTTDGTIQPFDVNVISFDGTTIDTHFFPALGLKPGQTAPTILDGPGLGLPGATNPNAATDEFLPDEVIGVLPLRQAGYNVITWDPRGEWYSGGTLEIDSPDFEAKDVSAIINWLATQPEAQLVAPADPRVGMVGASYGGGIQLVSAATDPRIAAIVPTIAWNTLNSSLYPNQDFKTAWNNLLGLALLGTFARVDPRIFPALIEGDLTGTLSQADQALLTSRGPGPLVSNITAPTLLIQGTVDTLFPLNEADANAKTLIADGVPTKVIWYCGGHGACITTPNGAALNAQETLDWLNRYVKGDTSVSTGPQFEWIDQNGNYFSSPVYPVPQGALLLASTNTASTLPLIPFLGGSGPQLRALGAGLVGTLAAVAAGSQASNAIDLTIPSPSTTTYVVGAPQLTFTYSGTGISRDVYAQLVNNTTGLVLGNQVTPIPVTLDGQTHTVSIPLEEVAQTISPGQTVTLQLVASATPFETLQTGGVLNVSNIQLTLPTAAIATPVPLP